MAKLNFKTWREDHPRVYTCSGSPVKVTYSGRYDDDGNLVLDEVGKDNVYETIQSYAESVDINNVIRRFTAGDTSALEQVQGIYMDATKTPKNMADLLNKINIARDKFDKLSPDVKELYGNDFARFICTFDPLDLQSLTDIPQSVEKPVQTSNDTTKEGE